MKSPLTWHGGKFYLASRLVEMMPPHISYVEPYAGSLAVLLAKNPEGVSEIVNDLDGRLMNFWRVLMCPVNFEEFARRVQATPFSEEVWRAAFRRLQKPCQADGVCVVCAQAFFVLVRQSHAGRKDGFAAFSKVRTRGGMNEQCSAWLTAVDGLPRVHARLKRVAILNRPALDVIRGQDGKGTLFYLDPPYLHETRVVTDVYKHEMSFTEHEELLDVLGRIQGKFMLSGYHSELYDDAAAFNGWRCVEFDLPNNAASGDVKRRMTECVWCNF